MAEGEKRKGTRCAVCTYCGRCFEDASTSKGWSGERCDVCVGCGKCMEAWGLVSSEDVDAATGPTSWADAFKVMDTGFAGEAPPVPAAPGAVSESAPQEPDAVTGATPGVASGCAEFGLDDMESLHARLGIKPPGEA